MIRGLRTQFLPHPGGMPQVQAVKKYSILTVWKICSRSLSCLLFLSVAAVYSLLNWRNKFQWIINHTLRCIRHWLHLQRGWMKIEYCSLVESVELELGAMKASFARVKNIWASPPMKAKLNDPYEWRFFKILTTRRENIWLEKKTLLPIFWNLPGSFVVSI